MDDLASWSSGDSLRFRSSLLPVKGGPRGKDGGAHVPEAAAKGPAAPEGVGILVVGDPLADVQGELVEGPRRDEALSAVCRRHACPGSFRAGPLHERSAGECDGIRDGLDNVTGHAVRKGEDVDRVLVLLRGSCGRKRWRGVRRRSLLAFVRKRRRRGLLGFVWSRGSCGQKRWWRGVRRRSLLAFIWKRRRRGLLGFVWSRRRRRRRGSFWSSHVWEGRTGFVEGVDGRPRRLADRRRFGFFVLDDFSAEDFFFDDDARVDGVLAVLGALARRVEALFLDVAAASFAAFFAGLVEQSAVGAAPVGGEAAAGDEKSRDLEDPHQKVAEGRHLCIMCIERACVTRRRRQSFPRRNEGSFCLLEGL
mmetsp:Transcript_28713/g.92439  ORF Transcript_28713/g.92439 Transcript_28713/m.92439 type:complete len:364 (+) Transcript_28713:76-1167(+)